MTDPCACPAHALAASRGFLCAQDVDLLHVLANKLPKKEQIIIADVGAGSGTTALAMFASRQDALVYTVDIDETALHWAGKAVENIGKLTQWYGIKGDAGKVPKTLNMVFDAVLHDAGHEYGDVYHDLVAWHPLLKPGGLCWVHDFGPTGDAPIPPNSYPGVARAVEELILQGAFDMVEMRGWGILLKKPVA